MTDAKFTRHQRVKRALDTVGAGCLLVGTAPISIGVAVAVLLDDGRPVIFTHERAGKDGRPFKLLKFRTMRNGTADAFGAYPPEAAVTRAGKVLRKTSLDELPQLVNILRGEMSFVGPRPALIEQTTRYSETQKKRLSVRPGITGIAQILYRNSATLSTRIRADVEYVETWSLRRDLGIILRTVPAVLFGVGVIAGQTASEVDDL